MTAKQCIELYLCGQKIKKYVITATVVSLIMIGVIFAARPWNFLPIENHMELTFIGAWWSQA